MLELQNEELARHWLSLRPDVSAAVFFNDLGHLTVVTPDGTIEPFISSPFNRQLEKCVVYLDDAHTRGTDLKLPQAHKMHAAITLRRESLTSPANAHGGPSSTHHTPTASGRPEKSKSVTISFLSQRLPPPARSMAGLTRSQSLFSLYTGVDACALAINSSKEFYLFMDLRAEQRWVSYNMNSRKWLTATNEFNCRLEALDASKNVKHIPKHPRALMEQLGNVEMKIATRIACNNFKCVYVFCLCPTI
jgi:hypothetical protein